MPKSANPEEIKRKREYVRFLTTQVFKLKNNAKFLSRKLEQNNKELVEYEKEKNNLEEWLKENN